MNADGFALLARLKNEPELIEEIDRCAWYARLDRRVNEAKLSVLLQKDKITYETVSVTLLARILDELT